MVSWQTTEIPLVVYHGAQSDVGNREGWHDNKAVCGKTGGKNHYGI